MTRKGITWTCNLKEREITEINWWNFYDMRILSYLINRFKKLTFCFVVQYHLSLFSRYCFCQVKSFGWPSSFTLFASCISVILPFQLKIKTSCATFTISSHDHALDSMKLVLWTLLWIGVLFSVNLLQLVIVIEILLLVLILGLFMV